MSEASPPWVPRATRAHAQWDYRPIRSSSRSTPSSAGRGIRLSKETLHLLWEHADIFLDNTANSQARNVRMRQQLLFMLVVHMATLMG